MNKTATETCLRNILTLENRLTNEICWNLFILGSNKMSKKNKPALRGKMSKKHYTIFGAAILMITVLHFLMQMSIIQTEHIRVVENTIKTAPIVELIPEINPQDLVVETQSAEIETVKNDYIAPQKQKETVPQKINLSEDVRPIVEARTPSIKENLKEKDKKNMRKTDKKKSGRELDPERLRRAEEILTGF